MTATVEYLHERHAYWLQRLARLKVWEESGFKDVRIIVRPRSRCYNGMFQHTYVKGRNGGPGHYEDRIIFYHNAPDLDPVFIDSVLVHEMIHQYLYHAGLHDDRSHGTRFRRLMKKINDTCPGELRITVTAPNPQSMLSGPGDRMSVLLILVFKKYFYCCRVSMKHAESIRNIVNTRILPGSDAQSVGWYMSDDIYFNSLRQCRSRLSGIRLPVAELDGFLSRYNLQRLRGL